MMMMMTVEGIEGHTKSGHREKCHQITVVGGGHCYYEEPETRYQYSAGHVPQLEVTSCM